MLTIKWYNPPLKKIGPDAIIGLAGVSVLYKASCFPPLIDILLVLLGLSESLGHVMIMKQVSK